MIGPVAALSAAVSTVALLAAQAKTARVTDDARAAVAVTRAEAKDDQARERRKDRAKKKKAKRKKKRKKLGAAIRDTIEDIVDAAGIPSNTVKVKDERKPKRAKTPPKPGKKSKRKSTRIKVKPNTVIKVLNKLGASLKLDNRFNKSDKTTYDRTAKRYALKIRKTTSRGKGKTALLDPANTWKMLKHKASRIDMVSPGKVPHTPPPAPDEPAEPKLKTREAAERLYVYVVERIRSGRARTLGDKANANVQVREYQAAMGKIFADGIYGPASRKRGKELLGREFPARAGKRDALPPPPPMDGDGAHVTTTTPDEPATEERPLVLADQREPQQAARELYDYVSIMVDAGKSRSLGSRGRPNATVREAQLDMGIADASADGIYGPGTRRKGKALINKTFPARKA